MKKLAVCSVLVLISIFSQVSNATRCNRSAAIVDYYKGPTNTQVQFDLDHSGVFYIKTYDADNSVVCTGGKAVVDQNCDVQVLKALFCDYVD